VRIREQHPATVDRATPRRLPRQSQARGAGQKRRCHLRLQCRPCESGAAASWRVSVRVREERSSRRRVPGGGRYPGFRESVALRGAALERGPRSTRKDEGNNPALRTNGRRRTKKGCSGSPDEEGNLRPRRTAAAGGGREDPSLGVARPVQFIVAVQRSSPQAVVGSGRRPQATSRLGGGFRGRTLRRACSAVGAVSEGLSRLAALVILLREGKVAVT
jgi:hypothetical protein